MPRHTVSILKAAMEFGLISPLPLLCIAVAPHIALAGNGKISGVVRDQLGEPLSGVSVTIDETRRGAATNTAGEYVMLNIPSGVYTVIASSVGHQRKTATNVELQPDQIVTLDFVLQSRDIALDEVGVVSPPLVDRSRTVARTNIAAAEFGSLPVREASDLISVSASVYNGFIRGGKVHETKTLVDGVDVSDRFSATAAEQVIAPYLRYNGVVRHAQAQRSSLVDFNLFSIENVSVLTGGTGADYTSASAGVIAYDLRVSKGGWSGRGEFTRSQTHLSHIGPDIYNDYAQYESERAALLGSTKPEDRARGERYTFVPGKYSYGDRPTVDAEMAFGGGITPDAGVYATLGYHNSHGRFPNEFTRRLNGSLKFACDAVPDFKITGTLLLEDRGRLFGWKNRTYAEDFRYFLEGVPKWDGLNVVTGLKVSHSPSPTTFFEVQASFVRDLTRRGFSDDNNDGIIQPGEDGDFLTFADTAQVNRYMAKSGNADFTKFFSPTPRNESGSEAIFRSPDGPAWKIARPGIYYERFVNSSATLQAHTGTQFDAHHLLWAGLQAQFHNLSRTVRAGYIGGVFPAYKNYAEEIWNVKPGEYGVFVQDRMEYSGFIMNLGLRFDAFNLAAADYANYFAPFRDDFARGDDGRVVDAKRLPVRGENAPVRGFLSPRVGVSHPISENAAMYFSFSIQQQPQPFSRLYSNYNDFGNPSLPVVTRTNQDPIRSTNYDLGLQWAFKDEVGLDVNAYYKDIQNYGTITLAIIPNGPWRVYNLVTNFGYADARGIEVTLRRNVKPVNSFIAVGGRLTYTHSYIRQAVYAGGNATSFTTATGDSARYNGQPPFDDINTFNTFEQRIPGGNSTLTGGYDRSHRFTFNILVKFPLEIALSGTGTFQSGFFYPLTLGDLRARELGVGPWNKRVDLRVEKQFAIGDAGRVALWIDMLNAFNWTNVVSYNTGIIGQQEWETHGDPTGGPKINRPVTQDGSPVYDVPREAYFGVSVFF